MKKDKNKKSKYEYIKEFEEWYKNEEDKLNQKQEPFIITPSDDESIDNV